MFLPPNICDKKSPPVGKTLGFAILMKTPCPCGDFPVCHKHFCMSVVFVSSGPSPTAGDKFINFVSTSILRCCKHGSFTPVLICKNQSLSQRRKVLTFVQTNSFAVVHLQESPKRYFVHYWNKFFFL
jgi:hypothetical protein